MNNIYEHSFFSTCKKSGRERLVCSKCGIEAIFIIIPKKQICYKENSYTTNDNSIIRDISRCEGRYE